MTISPIQSPAGIPVPVIPVLVRTTAASAPPLSASARPGTEDPATGVLSALTPSDRSLIAAATGVVISPSGAVVSGAGYVAQGNTGSVEDFAFVIAAARQIGAIHGRLTPQSLAGLFPPYITQGSSALSAAVANASTLLATSPAGPQPVSSARTTSPGSASASPQRPAAGPGLAVGAGTVAETVGTSLIFDARA